MIYTLTLNWNGLDKLKRLAPSFEQAAKHLNQDVIWHIRDNGSSDGSVEWLQSICGPSPHLENLDILNAKVLFVDHNRDNFAQGVNSLIDLAAPTDEDFVLLLNNDVEFLDERSIVKMMNLMKDPKVGVVGARLLYNGTNKLQHAGVIFGERYGKMPYHYRHKEQSDSAAESNRRFQAVTAACCLIRGSALQRMDEKFSWAFEDIDLCLRIGKQGWKVVYCGETNIFHEESASLKKNPVNKLFLSRNVSYFKKKWFGKYDLDHEKYLKNPNFNLIK